MFRIIMQSVCLWFVLWFSFDYHTMLICLTGGWTDVSSGDQTSMGHTIALDICLTDEWANVLWDTHYTMDERLDRRVGITNQTCHVQPRYVFVRLTSLQMWRQYEEGCVCVFARVCMCDWMFVTDVCRELMTRRVVSLVSGLWHRRDQLVMSQ